MENIKELIKKYDREFVKHSIRHTMITRSARNYIVFAEKVDGVKRTYWFDDNFLNGYSTIKKTKVEILENSWVKSVWYFKVIEAGNRIGYKIDSWLDCLDVQVSKETFDIVYQMIIEKQKEVPNSEIIITEI